MISDRDLEKFIEQLNNSNLKLKNLLNSLDDEDLVYRFYYQSFKVYWLQHSTEKIRTALQGICPDVEMDEWFLQIIDEGTGITFKPEHNEDWLRHTRPIVEAYWHAYYMLRMAVKYGHFYSSPPRILESGFAALLCLYRWR